MTRFIATAWKELLLLSRDRSGLLVLFVMPAVLVLVITLVQENVMKTMGESDTEILFIDHDLGMVGQRLEAALSKAGGVRLTKTLNGRVPDKKTALRAVAKGDFQLFLFVPEGMTTAVRANARIAAMRALSMSGDTSDPTGLETGLEIYFDPTIMGGFRSAVQHLLQLMILQVEVEVKLNQLSELWPDHLQEWLKKAFGPLSAEIMTDNPMELNLQWPRDPIIKISTSSAMGAAPAKTPNAVQQNIPAWSLFGIFFIVLPMAGSFIKERLCGVEHRILSLPVSYLTFAAGKMCAYMWVCLIQFGMIFLIGKTLLPLMGAAYFELGNAPMAVLLVALSAILAATSYGILLGTLVKTYEQASMFGPISIVIAAALGGIMVPVYAMPAFMQKISLFSPLAWAQNAFLELFVRGGDLQSVVTYVALLLVFASACIGTSWVLFLRKIRKGASWGG